MPRARASQARVPACEGKLATHVRYLSDAQGWGVEDLAEFFGLPIEEVRRAVGPSPAGAAVGPVALSVREVRSLVNDIRRDPYATPQERREVLQWVAAYVRAERGEAVALTG